MKKNILGEKIAEIRKSKGLTQEQLADNSGVNLRTIQRVENGETEPRGHTLVVICKALDIDIEDIVNYKKVENKDFFVWFYLSAVTGLLIPFVLWLINKDKIIGLDTQAKNFMLFRVCFKLLLFLVIIGIVIFGLLGENYGWDLDTFVSSMPITMGIIMFIVLMEAAIYPIFVAISIKRSDTLKSYYPRVFK